MTVEATERKRVEEAVETLSRYNKAPFITDFLKQQPAPRIPVGKYEKDELCSLIQDILLGEYHGKKKYVLSLENLVDYLDALQETGRQHVYFFHIPEVDGDAFSRLRSVAHVQALAASNGCVYGEGRLVWEARSGPVLVHLRHYGGDADRPRRLMLKWIETREYWAPQKHSESTDEHDENAEDVEHSVETPEGLPENQRVQVRVRREERAVSFLIINLDSRECELRIQAVHGQARATREEQQRTYRTLTASLLGIELVGPTVLAPAIRRALVTREMPIVRCAAILPDGGRFIGGKGEFPPVDIRALQAGVTIRFEWHQPAGGVGRVELDGRLDEILILRPLPPASHRVLMDQVRRWRHEGLTDLVGEQPTFSEVEDEASGDDKSTATEALVSALLAALRRTVPVPAVTQPGIDRAIREYARTHAVDEQSPSSAPQAAGGGAPAISGDARALEQFLAYIREVAQNERSTFQREIRLVRKEEAWTFRLLIIAAALALLIVASGAVLLFAAKLAIGTVTSLLGALTGGGTVLIRSHAKNLKTKREAIQDQQRDSQQTLLAIQTALSIPNMAERSSAMNSVAASLLNRLIIVGHPA